MNGLWGLGALCMVILALWLVGRRWQKHGPVQACTTPPDAVHDAFAEFEGRMRSVFDFALLNSDYWMPSPGMAWTVTTRYRRHATALKSCALVLNVVITAP